MLKKYTQNVVQFRWRQSLLTDHIISRLLTHRKITGLPATGCSWPAGSTAELKYVSLVGKLSIWPIADLTQVAITLNANIDNCTAG